MDEAFQSRIMISVQDSKPACAQPQLAAETKAGDTEEAQLQRLKRTLLHEIRECDLD